jgi:hypothetical protein
MLVAALNGKIPSALLKSEDILTSNVFSFSKYAERTIYLKALLAIHVQKIVKPMLAIYRQE